MNLDNYIPLQSGAGAHLINDVYYREHKPRKPLVDIVHCFWTLKTTRPLEKNFVYAVMPDACIDIVIDIHGVATPIIMTPSVAIELLKLGKEFHYVGIRFKPGVFANNVDIQSVVGNQKKLESILEQEGELSEFIARPIQSEQDRYNVLEKFVYTLINKHLIERSCFIENVLRGMQYGLSVDEVAGKVGYSSRQLQRKVMAQTGFSPIQLRRIVRFQSVLSSGDYHLKFADQSHLIKEFKAVTGVSYAHFASKYIDVRKIQS